MITYQELRLQKSLLKHIERKVKINDIKLSETEEKKVIDPKEKKKLKKVLKKKYGEKLAKYLFYLIIFFGYGYILTNKAISYKNSILNDPNNFYSILSNTLQEEGTGKIWGVKNPLLEMFLGYYLNGLSIKHHFFPEVVDYTNYLDKLSHFKFLTQYNKGNVNGHSNFPEAELNEKQIFIKAIEFEYKKYMNNDNPHFYEDYVTFLVGKIVDYYSLPSIYLKDQVIEKPPVKRGNPRLPRTKNYFEIVVDWFSKKPAQRNVADEFDKYFK